MIARFFILFCFLVNFSFAETEPDFVPIIRRNITQAKENDFVVVAFEQTYTLLHILKASKDEFVMEEITVPSQKLSKNFFGWRDWFMNGAIGHTGWIAYTLDASSGKIKNAYSYTRGSPLEMQSTDLFLSTLFNLNFKKIPLSERRKIGAKAAIAPYMDPNSVWNPPLIVDGKRINGVFFEAWKAKWPNDNSYLSDKNIEIYLPDERTSFSSYFPYWLQISGLIGKAKIRIIDSGSNLMPVKELPLTLME